MNSLIIRNSNSEIPIMYKLFSYDNNSEDVITIRIIYIYLASNTANSWHLPVLYHSWCIQQQGKIRLLSKESFLLQSSLQCMTNRTWKLFLLPTYLATSWRKVLLGNLVAMDRKQHHWFSFFHNVHTHAKVPLLHHLKDLKLYWKRLESAYQVEFHCKKSIISKNDRDVFWTSYMKEINKTFSLFRNIKVDNGP